MALKNWNVEDILFDNFQAYVAVFKITLYSPTRSPGYYLGYFKGLHTEFASSFIFNEIPL